MVLVLCLVLSVATLALGRYVQVAQVSVRASQARAVRLATVDAALRVGVERLRLTTSNCATSMPMPSMNGASAALGCVPAGSSGSWTRYTVTAVVDLGNGRSSGTATVQVGTVGGLPCTSTCAVTVNAWSVST
jgi:hypothetical protein